MRLAHFSIPGVNTKEAFFILCVVKQEKRTVEIAVQFLIDYRPSQVFADGCVRNEINDLTVRCPYRESGCDWEGKITSLQVSVSYPID